VWGQFTIQNWPHTIEAQTFRLQIVGATIGGGQFTIQNWPHNIDMNSFVNGDELYHSNHSLLHNHLLFVILQITNSREEISNNTELLTFLEYENK
jgi:hypothetical protein